MADQLLAVRTRGANGGQVMEELHRCRSYRPTVSIVAGVRSGAVKRLGGRVKRLRRPLVLLDERGDGGTREANQWTRGVHVAGAAEGSFARRRSCSLRASGGQNNARPLT